MTTIETPVRHLDTTVSGSAAITTWLVTGCVLVLTVVLAVIGLLLNIFSAGHASSQSLSWGAFDSPAPSSVFILIVLAAAWQLFTIGWCAMAAAAFKKTYKHTYIWSAAVTGLLFAAAIVLLMSA